jgi:glutathione S-transferase
MRPWLLLQHFDIEFDEIRIALDTEGFEQKLARYTDANKVPVLHDADLIVWDSLSICEYISENYLAGRGWPSAKAIRAVARSASAEMHSSFFEIREHMPMNCRAQRKINFSLPMLLEIQRIDQLWQQLRSKHGSTGEWLCGKFSIVDCMFAPMVSRFNSYQPKLSETSRNYISTMLNHSSVKLWYEQAEQESEFIAQSEVGVTEGDR